ncbi:hypothetical protein SAMN05446037_10352 [Anaerovirgula multivorans]|uniref:Uncharacterized protein n=1 Tax=Anaerovirgula multivorans TaxID=312168 RepID=A0A239JEZ8_9FIRM|nr:hypothetical protein SAMN05446037_10352 [Anaerovirgula multivorans]
MPINKGFPVLIISDKDEFIPMLMNNVNEQY